MQPGDIVSHNDMCSRERRMLQHGMNFRADTHSVLLMSRRRGAPYDDQVLKEGRILIYEGHDVPRRGGVKDPKRHDQPMRTPSGTLTPNGKFYEAAHAFKSGKHQPALVRVYEKIKDGIWTYNGVFRLVDAWEEEAGNRRVFKFRLEMTDLELPATTPGGLELEHNRMIPTTVKLEVYKRDKGQCVLCGSKDNLHFDHDYPYSKGGTSLSAENIRLLCVRHNLQKGAKIQ
ncbi:MAG TPA: HNH endonuclease [Terriglobales bacterium]|nr:HNH endonuclease [Terriglobales bacterium]